MNAKITELLKADRHDAGSLKELGDSYLELREYPLAIFYYSQALQQRPYSLTLIHQLNVAERKLGLPESSLLHWPPYGWALALVIPFAIVLGAVFFLYLWRRRRRWLRLSAWMACCCVFLLGYGFFAKYLLPIEGVVLQTTLLYPNASTQYPPLSTEPLVSGQRVRVVDLGEKGHWLKVLAPDGRVGYVDYQAMRIL